MGARPKCEIGVQRFDPGHGQHDAAEHEEAARAVRGHERECVARIERLEHDRDAHDRDRAGHADRHEPRDHRRPEQPPHALGAADLNRKQAEQHDGRALARRKRCNEFDTTPMPSTAEMTEIAGVMMPSPNSIAAPMTTMTVSTVTACTPPRRTVSGAARASSARMPPSPS